jgi:murein DD-endopeptidase MepM/ murein hydrolase activator NlpD
VLQGAVPVEQLPVVRWPAVTRWHRPVDGVLTSGFGPRWGRHHDGLDLAAPLGTPVRAAAAGTVVRAGEMGGLGLAVELEHAGGWKSRYGHLQTLSVAAGERVEGAQVLGLVGQTGNATGPHLHWELQHEGVAVDPSPLLANGGTP